MSTISKRAKLLPDNKPVMYILRGCSGSGKTMFADEMESLYRSLGLTVARIEADQYLYTETGDYVWTQQRVMAAHMACANDCATACESKVDVVIVSNMSVYEKDMKVYLGLANKNGYTVIRMVLENLHGGSNEHGVTDDRKKEIARVMRSNIKLI